MDFAEFVDYVKTEVADAVEMRSLDPAAHFMLLNGEGDDGAILLVGNVAFESLGVSVVIWEAAVIPLIRQRGFKRMALVGVQEEPLQEDQLAVGVVVGDGERLEGWKALIHDFGGSDPAIGTWIGPDPEATVPAWEKLEGALR